MAIYRVSPNAKDDLERIWHYGVEHWGMEAADAYHEAFFVHFAELAEQPYVYAESDIRTGYRRSLCGKDSVFYRINGGTVEIMAVLGKQDTQGWL
ncbi:type II toxin-antitoxin system RelE/ParE family toxin [Porticoccus sp. GXU_MW_L64]